MRLRTFIAPSFNEAMEQVRAAMGDHAIIVSSLEGENGGVEVTAALESRQTEAAMSDAPDASDEAALSDILRNRLRPEGAPKDNAQPERGQIVHPQERAEDEALNDAEPGLPFDADHLAQALLRHGLPPVLTDALIAGAESSTKPDSVAALAEAIAHRFSFAPLPVSPRAPIMGIGMPGSGKTVTLAKLAARALVDGAEIELITTDSERTGAFAQSEAYGTLLNHTVAQAESVDALSLLLDRRTEHIAERAADTPQACFIDTCSINPFIGSDFSILKRLIDGAALVGGTEAVLVLSANGDPRGMVEACEKFAQAGVSRMIITQLDIARRLGGVLAAAEVSGLAFSQISMTPYLARGLMAASPVWIARLLLGQTEALSRSATA